MRSAPWALLTSTLLLGSSLAWAGVGPAGPAGSAGVAPAALVPSEPYATAPGDPVDRRPPRDRDEFVLPPWDGLRVGLEVLVDGRPLRTVCHKGRTYLPVPRLGVEYEIRVWNQGPRRVTAIVSVDGLSVINGRPASRDHPGYIVAPRSDILIKGWRRDRDTVAAFSFEEREKSYASRVGHPENIGVIGLVAIEEMGCRFEPILEKKDAAVSSARGACEAPGGTGTGYGRDVDSRVYHEVFVRSDNKRTATLYYDTADALRKAGIPVDDPSPVPFPRDNRSIKGGKP
jgi:hypothetical protein